MYECSCGTRYEASNKMKDALIKETKEKGISELVIICPKCEHKLVIGGELDVYNSENGYSTKCIVMYTKEYEPKYENSVAFTGELSTK